MKKIVSIENKIEYQAALSEASVFIDNEPSLGSQEAIRFEALLNSIEAYEAKHYVIDLPDTGRPA